MTVRKPPNEEIKHCPQDVKRSHYACRLRDDYKQLVRQECERLNCSQGVFLELLLQAHFKNGIVTAGTACATRGTKSANALTGLHSFALHAIAPMQTAGCLS